jgi:hypothetical protein
MAVQLNHPVLWVDLILKLGHNHVNTLVEIVFETLLTDARESEPQQRVHSPWFREIPFGLTAGIGSHT